MKNLRRRKRRFFELSILISLLFLILAGNLWGLSKFLGETPVSRYFPTVIRDFTGDREVSPSREYVRDTGQPTDETGAIKYRDYLHTRDSFWQTGDGRIFVFDMVTFVIAGILLFSAAGLAASILGLGSVTADYTALLVEFAALISGDVMPE
jgi:hypothetical protein